MEQQQKQQQQQQQQQQQPPPPLHHPGCLVVVPPASSVGPSIATDSSSTQYRPSPWTRFRHNTMNPAPDTLRPLRGVLAPFRPRQQRYEPPVPRWNPRAADFHAIRSQLPPLTSRAACARYRLGRKSAVLHHRLTKRLDYTRNFRASSPCHALRAAGRHHIVAADPPSFSTQLYGLLKLTTPPRDPSSTAHSFFGG
ncbi:hypothetical protein B0H11DRAFT_2050077 [Mycena galericulata]|nr:hypothetical protein B0H11DRAFT_2050077 [Mycena galericulata]